MANICSRTLLFYSMATLTDVKYAGKLLRVQKFLHTFASQVQKGTDTATKYSSPFWASDMSRSLYPQQIAARFYKRTSHNTFVSLNRNGGEKLFEMPAVCCQRWKMRLPARNIQKD